VAAARLVPVPAGELEVEVRGAGEPVVLIQTALVADELRPLAERLLRNGGAQVILYHRRGYGRSTRARGAGSITSDALDCHELLASIGIERAHVVGASYAGAVALQLASSAPDSVHSLSVIEPPPVGVPSAPEFQAAARAMQADHRRYGPTIGLERFMVRIVGHQWRHDIEQQLPGAVAQVETDAATFFVSDLPAVLAWRFGASDAARITQPVLHVGGTESGAWFTEMRQRLLDWLPQAEAHVVTGADHNLVLTHTAEIAQAVTTFLRRHPIVPG
jgi:pimeloyl-ACP methyl ester carboxylesterase